MSRVIFYLHKEDADGNVTLFRNIKPEQLSATKNGAPYSTTFHNNNNGTYWFPASGSGEYSVLYNGTTQDEFRNIYIADSDSLINTDVDGTTIQLNAEGKLEIIDGGSILREADIIDNLKSTSIINPLSANQGRVISASIALKQDADTTVLREEDIRYNFAIGGTDKVQSAQSLFLDLSGTTYLSAQKDYNGAMRELDNKIATLELGGLYRSYLPYGYNIPLSEDSGSTEMHTIDNVENGRGYRMMRAGNITGLSVVYKITAYTRAGSGEEYHQLFDIYKNGVLIGTCQIDQLSPAAQLYSVKESSPVGSFSSGDTLTVYHRMQEGFGDNTIINNIALLIEVTN